MTSALDRARLEARPTGQAVPPEGLGARRSLSASLRRSCEWAALVLFAVAGAAMMLHLTRNGIGLWEDSFDYITAARSLVEDGRLGRYDGLGNFRPLTHFPPAYPWTLALLSLAGIDICDAARWLNVGLFGAVILLSGVSLRWATVSIVWGLIAAGLVLSSEVLIGVHLWALTEPLYLALALAVMLLVASYLAHPRRRIFLLLAALASAFALLTRYAGVATVIAGACGLVFLPGRPRARKWPDALVFLLISCLPLLAFMARNRMVSGAPTDEVPIAWHPLPVSEWEKAAQTVLNWGLPDVVVERVTDGWSLLALSAGILLTLLVAGWVSRALWKDWRRETRGGSAVGLLFVGYGAVYLFVFLATVLLVRRIVPADNRLLAPLYLALAAVLVTALGLIWRNGTFGGRILVIGMCVVMAGFQVWRLSGLLEVLPDDSRGFASNAWRQSETIAFLRTLPETLIYSNEIQAIYFLTGRTAIFVPTPINPATGQPRDDYATSLTEMRRMVAHGEAMLVLFASPQEILQDDAMSDLTLGLPLIAQQADGAVFGRIQGEGVSVLPGCPGQVLVQDGV